MVNIIVVFSSQKDGINIRNLLMRHGHNVVTVCTNGAAVSQAVDQMEQAWLSLWVLRVE